MLKERERETYRNATFNIQKSRLKLFWILIIWPERSNVAVLFCFCSFTIHLSNRYDNNRHIARENEWIGDLVGVEDWRQKPPKWLLFGILLKIAYDSLDNEHTIFRIKMWCNNIYTLYDNTSETGSVFFRRRKGEIEAINWTVIVVNYIFRYQSEEMYYDVSHGNKMLLVFFTCVVLCVCVCINFKHYPY